ncbi:hypothetical protein KL925_000267 [Ogataea polymorpha]|nr:hypothetical protein KL925_000267 [Ogataea polymorpha]
MENGIPDIYLGNSSDEDSQSSIEDETQNIELSSSDPESDASISSIDDSSDSSDLSSTDFQDASEIIQEPAKLSYYRLENKPRLFQGNINYLRFFQAEKRRFLSYTSPFGRSNLVGTYVSTAGFRYRRKDEVNEAGTYWSADDKDTFFELLARYSIHRADIIQEKLPSKSIADILDYYKLLKRELQQYKRHKRRLLKLVSYDEIPASYEMSSEFIEMEESQAFLLRSVANMRDSDTNFRFKKMHPGLNEQDLLDYERMADMANALYANNQLLDPATGIKRRLSKPMVLDEETKYILRHVAKNMAYEVVLTVLEDKIEAHDEFEITQSDVHRALAQMKVRRPIKLKDYWSNIGWRLGLEFGRQMPSGRQRLNKLVPYEINGLEEPRQKEKTPIFDIEGDEIEQVMDGALPFESAVLNPTPVSELSQKPAVAEPDEVLSEQLLELETALLERKDHEESVKQENWLLHYLSCRENEIMQNDADLIHEYVENKYRDHEPGELPKVPDHPHITNEMLFLHSFDYANYESD